MENMTMQQWKRWQ